MHISKAQLPSGDLPSVAETRYLERCGDQVNADHRSRSHSLNTYEQSKAKSLVERMKHTFEFKLNEPKGYDAFKGNTRSEYIQASFMTLENLFANLPESINFDIEISEYSPASPKKQSTGTNPLSRRISHAFRSPRLGNGLVRDGSESPGRHHPRGGLPTGLHPHCLLLLLQPRSLHPPLTQAERLPRLLPDRGRPHPLRRRARQQSPRSDPFRHQLAPARDHQPLGAVGHVPRVRAVREGFRAAVRVVGRPER